MSVDERARHALHDKLEETLGPEVTGTLMELLPPVGWADVATRHDVDALGHRMDARMSDLRTELHDGLAAVRIELHDGLTAVRKEFRTEVAGLRTEAGGLRTELRTEMAEMRTEIGGLRTEMAEMRTEIGGLRTGAAVLRTEMAGLRADLLDQMASSQRLLLFGMLTAMFTLAGLVWAAATVAA